MAFSLNQFKKNSDGFIEAYDADGNLLYTRHASSAENYFLHIIESLEHKLFKCARSVTTYSHSELPGKTVISADGAILGKIEELFYDSGNAFILTKWADGEISEGPVSLMHNVKVLP